MCRRLLGRQYRCKDTTPEFESSFNNLIEIFQGLEQQNLRVHVEHERKAVLRKLAFEGRTLVIYGTSGLKQTTEVSVLCHHFEYTMRLATAVARCRAAALRSPLSTAMPLSLRCFTTSSLVASRPTPPVRPTPAARPTPSVAPNGAGSVTAGAANAGSSTAHAKPRAIHSGTMARRPQRRLWVAGIAAAAGAGAVYIIYSNMKPEEPASANTQEFLTRLPGRVHATILDMQYSLSAYFAALLETKLSDPTPDDLMNSESQPAPFGCLLLGIRTTTQGGCFCF